jgi:hypothetical protein
MPLRRPHEEPAPPRTDRPLRQIVVYLCITYGLALAIALALPHADIAPLISIAVPVTRSHSLWLSSFRVDSDAWFGLRSDSNHRGGGVYSSLS